MAYKKLTKWAKELDITPRKLLYRLQNIQKKYPHDQILDRVGNRGQWLINMGVLEKHVDILRVINYEEKDIWARVSELEIRVNRMEDMMLRSKKDD